MTRRVRVAVTMGDPGGIGPEVVLKAITMRAVAAIADPILVGDPGVWRETAARLGLRIGFTTDAAVGRQVRLVPTSNLAARDRQPGAARSARAAAAAGESAHVAIVAGVRLVQNGTAAALVTAPISKAHVVAAGHDFPGHTELLAQLCGDVRVRMMMVGPRLRVALATTHVRLSAVPRALSRAGVRETITITAAALRRHFGVARPRLAVTGLNPHAGEGGLFGDEEVRVIAPAIRSARRAGIDARGPLAADGVFAQALTGTFDAVVCMYHDQGLGPFKLLHFADGVNFTAGLPFVRTSPDHGTAFDIAGQGVADARSMAAALCLAARPQVNLTLERHATAAVS